MKLNEDPEIILIAQSLKIPIEGDAVSSILYFCRRRIDAWLKEHGPVRDIRQLERLVCSKLQLTIEEFGSEAELEQICDRYAAKGEGVFKSLPGSFDEGTYATLLERRKAGKRSRDRFVALVDCRGNKYFRRFFTRWHEIAHIMTNGKQLLLPLHRSSGQQNGEEKLMDRIAAEIGYYPTLFDPVLKDEISREGRLTFEAVDRVRSRFSDEASFEATLRNCIARAPIPVSFIECGIGRKAGEDWRALPKLRVLKATHGQSAPRFHRNIAVPAQSRLTGAFHDGSFTTANLGFESMSIWMHSDGRALGTQNVHIEARRSSERLWALVTAIV